MVTMHILEGMFTKLFWGNEKWTFLKCPFCLSDAISFFRIIKE